MTVVDWVDVASPEVTVIWGVASTGKLTINVEHMAVRSAVFFIVVIEVNFNQIFHGRSN